MKTIINSRTVLSPFTWIHPLLLCILACTSSVKHENNPSFSVVVQPFNDADNAEIKLLTQRLAEYIPHIKVAKAIALPEKSFYPERKRYRADSIIHFLGQQSGKDEFVVGITNKDISTSVHGKKDWGVMGLGFRPGPSCVVSTFRLSTSKRSEQLFKVAIHELGHTQGLDHCPVENCFMRDAEGRNITDELTEFCVKCADSLRKRGWKLPKEQGQRFN